MSIRLNKGAGPEYVKVVCHYLSTLSPGFILSLETLRFKFQFRRKMLCSSSRILAKLWSCWSKPDPPRYRSSYPQISPGQTPLPVLLNLESRRFLELCRSLYIFDMKCLVSLSFCASVNMLIRLEALLSVCLMSLLKWSVTWKHLSLSSLPLYDSEMWIKDCRPSLWATVQQAVIPLSAHCLRCLSKPAGINSESYAISICSCVSRDEASYRCLPTHGGQPWASKVILSRWGS